MVGRTDDEGVVHLHDELSELDRKIVGGSSVRLEIPITDKFTLRKLPDMLRGFAAHIENQSRRPDLADRTILLDIKAEARAFNSRIREIRGVDNFNKNGTTKAES